MRDGADITGEFAAEDDDRLVEAIAGIVAARALRTFKNGKPDLNGAKSSKLDSVPTAAEATTPAGLGGCASESNSPEHPDGHLAGMPVEDEH